MLVLITYDGRIKPPDVTKTTAEERDALYRSMVAYGGTYTYSGNRIEHHVEYRGMKLGAVPRSLVTLLEMATVCLRPPSHTRAEIRKP